VFIVKFNISLVLWFKDIKRNFETIVDLGSGPGHFSKLLEPEKVKKSIMIDISGTFNRSHLICLISNTRCDSQSRRG